MGNVIPCTGPSPVLSAERDREALEDVDRYGYLGEAHAERPFGPPIAYSLRKAAQDAHKEHLQELGQKVSEKLANCDCPKEDIDQFEVRGILGKGGFGIVVVGAYCKDMEDYAIKIQRKRRIEGTGRIPDVIKEKKLQYALGGHFAVELKYTHKDNTNIYMMMEFSRFGDFGRCVILSDKWKPTEPRVKLFAAQIVLALEFLHNSHIIFRDLKPENFIVFPDGYMKLSDFGLAKRCKDTTFTACGTLAYMAPELIKEKGHGKAVDWWAFGVMVFEMFHRKLPFTVPTRRSQTKKNITEAKYKFDRNLQLSKDVRRMIEQLLQVSPASRLGNLVDGVDDVKLHPWFSDINFNDVYAKKYKVELFNYPVLPASFDQVAVFGMPRPDDPHAEAFADF